MLEVASEAELDETEEFIDGWLSRQVELNESVLSCERGEPAERLWFVRLAGQEKATFSILFQLKQRTLHYETYFLPEPQHAPAELYQLLMRRNFKLYGAAYSVGPEDAVFLAGRLPVEQITEAELDRVLGTLWEETERSFKAGLRLAFGVAQG